MALCCDTPDKETITPDVVTWPFFYSKEFVMQRIELILGCMGSENLTKI